MKIYQIRGKRGKLKYSDEHIHFKLDGTDEYNWRKVLSEINQLKDLSLPHDLEFETIKADFKKLKDFDWLKCGFLIPIISKKLFNFIKPQIALRHDCFQVKIINKMNQREVNEDFVAIYLRETFNCLDLTHTEKIISNGVEQYDFQKGFYKDDLEYPILFKIQEMKMLNTHYCTEKSKEVLTKFAANSFDFFELSEINMS